MSTKSAQNRKQVLPRQTPNPPPPTVLSPIGQRNDINILTRKCRKIPFKQSKTIT